VPRCTPQGGYSRIVMRGPWGALHAIRRSVVSTKYRALPTSKTWSSKNVLSADTAVPATGGRMLPTTVPVMNRTSFTVDRQMCA
jgi:hypothetical protein